VVDNPLYIVNNCKINEEVLTRKLFKTPDTSGEEYINRIKDYTL